MDTPPTVLIVEDNTRTVELLDLLFRTEGYATESVADGTAALERVEGPAPALVVLDLMMPGVNGVDILRSIRSRPAWRDTAVIITSAQGEDEQIWEGWRAGADYYLVKPYKLEVLWSTAEELLRTGQISPA